MKKDKPSIDDIAIEAEKLGISYGRYVALRDGLIKVENISQNKKGGRQPPERRLRWKRRKTVALGSGTALMTRRL